MSKYDKWYIIRKLLCSTFRICKKICKFAKIEFLIAKSSYIVKCLQTKICPKNEKLYIFEKPLTMPFQICKNFCKILNNLICNQEKLKMCKFDRLFAKICNFFSQNLRNPFPYVIGFQKTKFYQNLTSESGLKQRFSLLQAKAVIQAVSIKARF